jgi:hypothetical protein
MMVMAGKQAKILSAVQIDDLLFFASQTRYQRAIN